jgi:hypothetical protein
MISVPTSDVVVPLAPFNVITNLVCWQIVETRVDFLGIQFFESIKAQYTQICLYI